MTTCYLVRHGEAAPGAEDRLRPLTERGREDVRRVARYAAALAVRVAEIRHSGLVRARETAEILADHLAPRPDVRPAEGLAPDDEPATAQAMLESAGAPLMLVGH